MKWKAVVVAAVAATAFVASVPRTVTAAFSATGSGSGRVAAQAVPAVAAPAASAAGQDVTVTWSPATLTGGTPVTGYVVRRYDLGGTAHSVLSACTSVVGTSCVEQGVPVGTWRYTVQPTIGGWRGPESATSAQVTTTLVPAPAVQTVEVRDSDADGRADRVIVTFDQVLHPSYTAGVAPWTLANVPSGGTLSSVSVSGATATLVIAEGAGAPNTAVGTFTVALAANAAGIRNVAGQLSSFTARSPIDAAAPALVTLTMLDSTSNGKVDRVTALFSEPLATYSAGIAPWTLANVPSGGTASTTSLSSATITLTITEGAGAADTAAGLMTVALAASATGVRDAAGNQTSFAATAPIDGARPVPMAINDTAGANDGIAEPGDTLSITFSEPLAAATVPSTTTLTLADPTGGGNDTLSVVGVTNGARNTGSNSYVSTNGASAAFAASVVTRSDGDRTVTVTLGATCSGSGCAALAAPAASANLSFLAATTLRDLAGNAPVTAARNFSIRLF